MEVKTYTFPLGVSVERIAARDEWSCDVFEIKNLEVEDDL